MKTPDIRRILMTTDLSEASWAALPLAADLAARYEAELEVCSVIEEPSQYLPPGQKPAVDPRRKGWMEDAAVRARDRITSRLAQEKVSAQVGVVRSLDPASTILEQAERSSADLVIIATHGRTGLGHLMMGSVAEKIVRRSSCPVITVRSAALPKG